MDGCLGRRRLLYLVKIVRSPFIPAEATYIRSMLLPRATWIIRFAGLLRALGPYAAIELILPGGTLIAIAVWAIRRWWWPAARTQDADARARTPHLREPALDLEVAAHSD
jgi:hypothetical protein